MAPVIAGLSGLIARYAVETPDDLGAIDAVRAWTWRELAAAADRFASAFDASDGVTEVLLLPPSGGALALLAANERARGRA
ncbi:MAG TPA: hypothetical protein VGM39_14240, partial [Kofleriaceae bacterium]